MPLIKKNPGFILRFSNQLNKFKELSKNDRVVVAVSGGLDSVTLLHLLCKLNFNNLIVAHVNHKIRTGSNGEELFVKNLCGNLKVPFYKKCLNPYAANKKSNIENWARIERYSYFFEILTQTCSKWIMTAHHANDQVETLFMNMAKKTGVQGLAGIAEQNEHILRPLLRFEKKDIRKFALKMGYSFFEDPSNNDIRLSRNFIRHEIVFPWQKSNPDLISGITKSVDYFREWKSGLDYLIKDWIISKIEIGNDEFSIKKSLIHPMPSIIKLRLFQLLFTAKENLWSKHQKDMLLQFLKSDKVGKIFYSHTGWRLLNDRCFIFGDKKFKYPLEGLTAMNLNKEVTFNNYKYNINIIDKEYRNINTNPDFEFLDWDRLVNQKIQIRLWEKGDIFQPLGMKGHQKLSDFLINEKINRIEKETQTVITADGKIFWVCGRRIADWVKITKNTKQRATICRKTKQLDHEQPS